MYVSGLASYLQLQGHQVIVIAVMPPNAFEDHPVFFEDEQLKTIAYQLSSVKIIGVVLKDSNTAEIYKKFRPQWVYSWCSVLNNITAEKWDVLHIHANTAAIGTSLIKAAKLHTKDIKVIASYHVPISCVKGTLLFANTMKECAVKPAINICTACFISSKQNWPIGITKKLAAVMPLRVTEKLPTAIRIKLLVKQFISSFHSFDKEITLWHVFSEQIRSILQLNGVPEKKISLLRHGVNPYFFEKGMGSLLSRKDLSGNIFLYAGRFEKDKGFFTLLKAWCVLPETKERELWIIGEKQADDEEIAKSIQTASQRKDIHWLGPKGQEELALVMKKVHCTIIPSEWVEIGPLVFHEAIAAGSDVIASGIGGCKELAELYYKKTGLFEPGNSDHLAKMIVDFNYSATTQLPLSQIENYHQVEESYVQLIAG